MNDNKIYRTLITETNAALATLELSWTTPVFTADDGIAPMASLHQAGDSVVAIAKMDDEGVTIIGSGVMVGPGLALTATHVLDEFPADGGGPIFFTFLPHGGRAWLPREVVKVCGPSEFDENRKRVSDLSLVCCTLNSDAHEDFPLMLAPMQVGLPLVGERLWAFGFRHQLIDEGAASVSPMVSSGLVTAAYPHGRGERMPSPCFEVNMETLGGMSGGPVVNSDGYLVGIVSSSFDGGPSYVTLIWDALRLSVNGTIPKLSSREVNLVLASKLGLAKIKGKVERKPWGDVVVTMSDSEMSLLVDSSPRSLIEESKKERETSLSDDEIEEFVDARGREMENAASYAAIESLERLSLPAMHEFLGVSGIPAECLEPIQSFSVEDFEGVEDPEIVSTSKIGESRVALEYFFNLRSVFWTVEVPEKSYRANDAQFNKFFMNVCVANGTASMQIMQRCYFKAQMTFDREQEEFLNTAITWSAVKVPKKLRS